MNCLFCKMISGEIPCKKIYEDNQVIAILDLHPSSDGHTLIIPKKHYDDMLAIDNDMLIHIYNVAQKLTPILIKKMNLKV